MESASATISFIPIPDIILNKTVGFNPAACAASANIIVPRGGGTVYYCYEVTNTGNITLSLHDVVDERLGSVISNVTYELGPGDSVDSVSLGVVASDFITENTTSAGTWTAYNVGPVNVVSATASTNANLDSLYRLYLPAVRKVPATTAQLPVLWLAPLVFFIPAFGIVTRRRWRR
jgi:hypothetical protein